MSHGLPAYLRFDSVVCPARTCDAATLGAIPPIVNMLAFPMPVGNGDSFVFAEGARAFRDLNTTGVGVQERSSFELALGILENHKLGTPFLKPSALEGVHTYRDLRDVITTTNGQPNKAAYENSASIAQGSTQYNPLVATRYREILDTRSRRPLAEGGSSGGGDTPTTGSGGVPQARAADPQLAPGVRYADVGAQLQQQQTTTAREREVQDAVHEADSGWASFLEEHGGVPATTSATASAEAGRGPEPMPLDGSAETSMMAHDRTVAMTTGAAYGGTGNSTMNELRDKLTVLIVPFHSRSRADSGGQPIFEGALMLVLVHDPLWNPGVGVLELIHDLKKMTKTAGGGSGRGGSGRQDSALAELQFRYKQLPPQNLLSFIDDTHYRNLCQTYVGASAPLPKDERDVSLTDHAAHPFRIWTLDRALACLEATCLGGDAMVELLAPFRALQTALDEAELAANPVDGSKAACMDVLLHVQPDLRAYRIDHRDCRWMARVGTGLAVQYLPWEDGAIAIRVDEDDSGALKHAAALLYASSQGAGGGGRSQMDVPVEHSALVDGTMEVAVTDDSTAAERSETERRIQQFFYSTHVASYDALGLNPYDFQHGDANWCVAMSAKYAPVRAAFEQAGPALPAMEPNALVRRPNLDAWLGRHARFANAMHQYERACGQLFAARIWQQSAQLTPSMKAIVMWQRTGGERGGPGFRKVTSPVPVNDRFCDLIGNVVLQEGLVTRYMRRNVSATREFVMMHYFLQNAYRWTQTLHNNKLDTGPAGVGKSFSQEEVIAMLIPNTVTNLTSESTFSNADDSDRSDHITIYDEMPYHIMGSGGRNDKNGQGSRAKSSLTTGYENRRVLELIETVSGMKKRVSRIVTTYMIGCVWIASNVATKDIEPAMVSRFLHTIYADVSGDEEFVGQLASSAATQDHRRRAKPSINELRAAHVSSFEQQLGDGFVKQRRVEQALVAAAYKQMQTGVLPEPTMVVCDLLINKLLIVLKEKGLRTGSFRQYERVYNTAHSLTVSNAILCAFRHQYGGDWLYRDFSVSDLRLLTPYLFCTKQNALLAFTFLIDEFVNPMQGPVLRALYAVSAFPTAAYADLKEHEDSSGNAVERLALANPKITWRQLDDDHVDLNYVMVKGDFYDVARQMRAHMKIKPSVEDIVSILQDLTGALVTMDAVESVKKEELEGAASSLWAQALERRPDQRLPAVIRERMARSGQPSVCVCVEAFQLVHAATVVREAIKELAYEGMKPQTYVLGMMSRENSAHGVFDKLEITAAMCAESGRPTFKVRSGDYMEESERHALFSPFTSRDPDHYDTRGRVVTGAIADLRRHEPRDRDAMEVDDEDDDDESQEGWTAVDPDAYGSDGEEAALDPYFGGHDDDDDDEDDVMAGGNSSSSALHDAERDGRSAFAAIEEHLNHGRGREYIEIHEDLDDYGALQHFARVGVPLAAHPTATVADDNTLALSERVCWMYTNPVTGRKCKRPLPTPYNVIHQINRGLRENRRDVQRYNNQYTRHAEAVRRQHCLPLPARAAKVRTTAAAAAATTTTTTTTTPTRRPRRQPATTATATSTVGDAASLTERSQATPARPKKKKRVRKSHPDVEKQGAARAQKRARADGIQ